MTSTTTSPIEDTLFNSKEDSSYGVDLTTTSNSDIDHLPVSVFGSEPPGTPPVNPEIAPPGLPHGFSSVTSESDTEPAQVYIGTDVLTVQLPKGVLLAMSLARGEDHGSLSAPYSIDEINAASMLVQELTRSAGQVDFGDLFAGHEDSIPYIDERKESPRDRAPSINIHHEDPFSSPSTMTYSIPSSSSSNRSVTLGPAPAKVSSMIDTSAIDRYTNGLLGDAPSPKFNAGSVNGVSNGSLQLPGSGETSVRGGQQRQRRSSSSFEFERRSTATSANGGSPVSDVPRMCRDAKGSARLQEYMDNATPEECSIIIREQLAPNVVPLSMHTHGCRVIQKAIEVGSVEDCRFLAAGTGPNVIELCADVNGNHVMQKFIECLPSEEVQFIVDALVGKDDATSKSAHTASHVLRLSVHCYGCRVLQRLLQKCDMAQKQPILDAVVYGTTDDSERHMLVNDQFGNYVVQHSIQFGRPEDRHLIAQEFLLPFVGELCSNKFGSNVVEKSLECCDIDDKRALVRALLTPATPGVPASCPIVSMMKDRYANYVVGRILSHDEKEMPEVKVVRRLVEDNVEVLKKFTYGWYMIEKLQRAGRINVPSLGKAPPPPPKSGLSVPNNNRRRASSSAYSSFTDASFSGSQQHRRRRSSLATSPHVDAGA
ncbi:hypothetical protein FOL47_005836 [Perkinsus chesapeaki]|uniref:PUM-HD domain-containing protein n=1 Tax=Perkinsus chesapeaki TaxID=330153 RepID=A0A7J6LWU7_PERCH|nr:hypothetical protein FOL47_005836 [Perkinsus chesapeaki]